MTTFFQQRARRLALAALVCGLWLGASGAAQAQDLARGEVVFGYCTQCHGEQGWGEPLSLAPAIAGLPVWFVEGQLNKFRSGLRGTHFDDIAGMRMRPMSLSVKSEEDVKHVAAYVASLPVRKPATTLMGGDPKRGAERYKVCISCHAADGTGNQALTGAPLANLNDWYLLRQLENFKTGVRGTNPKDMFATTMRPMAMQLDEQGMKDVIAYINSLAE